MHACIPLLQWSFESRWEPLNNQIVFIQFTSRLMLHQQASYMITRKDFSFESHCKLSGGCLVCQGIRIFFLRNVNLFLISINVEIDCCIVLMVHMQWPKWLPGFGNLSKAIKFPSYIFRQDRPWNGSFYDVDPLAAISIK